MGATLANGGVNPKTGKRLLDEGSAPELLAIMLTAGFYDESGRWAFDAGLPSKTGVGGGIVAVVPGKLAIAAFSPRLNEAGNSVRAQKAIRYITGYPEARLIRGLVLFRWDASLFFANAELFRERVLDAAASSPTPVRWVVVAAEPVTSVDVTAADVLMELDDRLQADGIELLFAEMKDPVKDKLKRFELFARVGAETFYATVGEAVKAYLGHHPVE